MRYDKQSQIDQKPMLAAQGATRVFTPKELSLYNGTNGNLAYVAVNGTVYDVTDDPLWYTLMHFGLSPGQDLSLEFNTCHSNRPFLLNSLVPVGILESGEEYLPEMIITGDH